MTVEEYDISNDRADWTADNYASAILFSGDEMLKLCAERTHQVEKATKSKSKSKVLYAMDQYARLKNEIKKWDSLIDSLRFERELLGKD